MKRWRCSQKNPVEFSGHGQGVDDMIGVEVITMFKEFELPLLPSLFVIFAVGVMLVGLVDNASVGQPACSCPDAHNGAEIMAGHLPGCSAGPAESYTAFR